MPIRALLRYISGPAIEKLAESYPMRRAAQLTIYWFYRGKGLGQDTMKTLKDSDTMDKIGEGADKKVVQFTQFKKTFGHELKKGFKELKDEMEKKQGR